jgi:hypothetical protein
MNQQSGQVFDRIFKSIYYDVRNPASFSSVKNLYSAAKLVNKNITKKLTKNWLSKQKTYTLHKAVKKNFRRNPIIVQNIDEQWQLDLIDFSNLSKYNNNFKYLLVIIDVLSKFVWVEKLYNKSGQSIVDAFQKVIKFSERKPQFIFSDPGSKYISKALDKFLII